MDGWMFILRSMLSHDTYFSFHSTHHIFDLWQGDLQGDIEGVVCVLYRSQSVGVVLHQIIQKFAGIMTLSTVGHWGVKRKPESGNNNSNVYNKQMSRNCRIGFVKTKETSVRNQNDPSCWPCTKRLIHTINTSFLIFNQSQAEGSIIQQSGCWGSQIQSVNLFWTPFCPEWAVNTEKSQNLTSCQKLWMSH